VIYRNLKPGLSLIHCWLVIAPLLVFLSRKLGEGQSIYEYMGITSASPPCIMRLTTGLSCGSCGMTGAFHAITKGDLLLATQRHPLSIPLFGFFMFLGLIAWLDILNLRKIPDWWFKYYKANWSKVIFFFIIAVLLAFFVRMQDEIASGCLKEHGIRDYFSLILHFYR
jgi:hypothetical protein